MTKEDRINLVAEQMGKGSPFVTLPEVDQALLDAMNEVLQKVEARHVEFVEEIQRRAKWGFRL